MDHLVDARVSEAFRVHIPERPTFSLLRSKAGIIGRPIGQTSGTVVDQVAAQAGVIRVSNGFRCPDDMTNGGTFTDAMGTTCGVRVVMGAVENLLEGAQNAAAGVLHTEGRDGGKAAAVLAKNEAILSAIADAGGHLFAPTPEMAKAYEGIATTHHVYTPQKAYNNQKRAALYVIDEMREYLKTGKRRNSSDDTDVPRWHHVDHIHPDVRRIILESSDEELMSIMQDTAMRFHEGVSRNIHVSIPNDHRFDAFLEEGYKTTHKVASDHSGSDVRIKYELSAGFPPDLDPGLRPASGYVTHPDWQEANIEVFKRRNGVEPTEFSEITREAYGNVGIYGKVDVILRPEVSGRAGYGQGDSLTTALLPTRFDETDPEKVFTAVVSAGGRERVMDRQVLALLEANRTGSFKYLNSLLDASNPEGEEKPYRQYFEALIPGSFGVEDVAAVRMDYYELASRTISAQDKVSGKAALERTKQIRDEFFTTEKLQQMGFSDEEVQYILGMLDNYRNFDRTKLSIPSDLLSPELERLLDFRLANERKAFIEAKGIEVQVTHFQSTNPFDPKTYGGEPGDDIEKILFDQYVATLPERVRNDRATRERNAREKEERLISGEEDSLEM